MIERHVKILPRARRIFMMLGRIFAESPLHPVMDDPNPEQEGNYSNKRPKYPGRLTEEIGTKQVLTFHASQRTKSCYEQCAQHCPQHLVDQPAGNAPIPVNAKEEGRKTK